MTAARRWDDWVLIGVCVLGLVAAAGMTVAIVVCSIVVGPGWAAPLAVLPAGPAFVFGLSLRIINDE